MAHEKSIGIEVGGRHFNIPTVVNGVELPPQDAIRFFMQGTLRPLGMYSTKEEADREARKRSRNPEEY